jgi:hypothetical protein
MVHLSSECLLQSLQTLHNQINFVLRRLDPMRRLFLKSVNNPNSLSDLRGINNPICISAMRQAISNTPEPSPWRGLAISAFPPSDAEINAAVQTACAAMGNLSNSLRAALTQEMGRVCLILCLPRLFQRSHI